MSGVDRMGCLSVAAQLVPAASLSTSRPDACERIRTAPQPESVEATDAPRFPKWPNEQTHRYEGGHTMHWSWNDSWSGWNWMLMMIGMIAFWGLVTWAIVAIVRSPNRSQHRGGDSAEQILAGRFASGEIEGDEYQHRLDVLRSGKVPTGK